MADRTEHLRAAAQARHDATLRRAENTLRALARRGGPITVRGLATAAGVSRSWIYQQPRLRAEIDRLREHPPARGHRIPTQQRASIDSLRQQLRAYRDELARLRAENQALTGQLAHRLGTERAQAITSRP